MQYKQQFIPNMNTLLKDRYKYEDDAVGWIIKLPNSLPSSSIVEKQDNYEEQIVLLYNKYIKSDADLCINISYDARKQFMSDMDEVTGNEKSLKDLEETKVNNQDGNDGNRLELTIVENDSNGYEEQNKYIEMRNKMLKIFDCTLRDIDSNLAASFIRFKLYGNLDVDVQQDIIDVMVEQTKEGTIK